MLKLRCFLFIIFVVLKVSAVPPAVCRAEFRWDDCGKPAKPVMYYWKQGSRCEIGYWKGCLPNPNMFADEYECINTCVFVDRPPPTESEAPEVISVASSEGNAINSTPADHNVSTTDITNGSTAEASTEKNESGLTTPNELSPNSSEANNNGSETTDATTTSEQGGGNETIDNSSAATP